MRNTRGVVVFLLAVAVCGAAVGQVRFERQSELCPKIVVSAEGVGGERVMDKFSATVIEDLTVSIAYPGVVESEHVVSLLVYTPRNHLYRRIDVPVAPAGTERGGATRRLPGYPYPVEVRRPAQERAGENVVSVAFPVAGTTIVTSSLYGRWRVEALIDGEAMRCIDAPRFYITE